jgi:RNA-directed DNA polymerase
MDLLEGYTRDMSGSQIVSTRQRQIAELAKQAPDMSFTSLNKHLDMEWMREAYRRTRKDGAVGVDGQTASDFETDLEKNLQDLLERAKSGKYVAPPVRRVYIPKGDGTAEARGIGIPTFEDKVLQRAVAMLLEPIYEQDFLDVSYGFRPRRSAHQALEKIWKTTMNTAEGWVLEVDIRKYFDSLVKPHLQELLKLRVRDGVVQRLIGKWLQAGVMEDGTTEHPETGVPQGGVISPILSNVYLHYVLDLWYQDEVAPRLKGKAELIRYADDFLIVFATKDDAERVMEVLPKRFERYGLRLHPEKTRLLRFARPTNGSSPVPKPQHPETFTFLGFTHYWGKGRKGTWVVKRKTAANRLKRAITRTYAWCKRHRHLPVKEQHAALKRKLEGHYGYYGITGNGAGLEKYRTAVCLMWRKWLNRRSQKNHMPFKKFKRLLARYPLPTTRVVHSVYGT